MMVDRVAGVVVFYGDVDLGIIGVAAELWSMRGETCKG